MGKSNQKTVKVNKELCNKENIYTAINLDALNNAAKVLDGDAFKMWIYFSKNQNGYEFELSSKHAEETFSFSKRRYDNAIKELTKGGFLVDANIDPNEVKNRWTFYEIPLEQNNNKPLQQNDTSLGAKENKSCICVDTRNNTDNTNKKIENSLFSVGIPKDFDSMTEKQKKDYFAKNVF